MAERIIAKLKEKEFKGFRTVTVTVRFSDFQTTNRSRSFKDGIRMDDDALRRLQEATLSLIQPFFDARENPRAKAFDSSASAPRNFFERRRLAAAGRALSEFEKFVFDEMRKLAWYSRATKPSEKFRQIASRTRQFPSRNTTLFPWTRPYSDFYLVFRASFDRPCLA